MVWYKQLKFDENPLDSRPNPNLINMEDQEEQLINHISKEEICFINGPTGSGKTSLLLKVKKKLKDHKFIYLDADDLPKNFDLEEELKKQRNFFDMLTLKKYPSKKPVLIIDEFQATDPNLVLKARSKWEANEQRTLRSIIIAQIDKHLSNTSGSFKERLGKRMISLNIIDNKGMKDMLKMRLNNTRTKTNYADKFTEEAINLLIKCADNSPRRLLEYTDLIFDFHYTKFKHLNPILKGKDYRISHFVIEDILNDRGIIVEEFKKKDLRNKRIPFDEKFDEEERKVLQFVLEHDYATSKEISQGLEMSPVKVGTLIGTLKLKEGIVVSGRRGKYKVYEISPGVKRAMIKE
ncbi:AAA family ATPase [Candidatus Woesearchaeota archaeon]|nr:AAA family ATPase [Candidatus Woesearchaeota archaeon]